MANGLRLVLASVVSLFALPILANVVTGRVVGADGFAVPSAVVKLLSPARSPRFFPVQSSGSFRIVLDTDEPSVMIEIAAPGFERRRRTLVFERGVADVGSVTMSAAPALRAYSLTVARATNHGHNEIDVLLENPLQTNVEISAIRIEAIRKKNTDCLDGAKPALSFAFGDTVSAGRIAYTASDATAKVIQAVETRGSLRTFPCAQVQLDLEIAMPFVMRAGEVQKLRFVVPARMKVTGKPGRQEVDLPEYATVAVTVHSTTGDAQATRRKP